MPNIAAAAGAGRGAGADLGAWLTGSGTEAMPNWFGHRFASGFDIFSRVHLRAADRPRRSRWLANALSLADRLSRSGSSPAISATAATELLMRVSDVMQSFPVFISAMVLVALAGQSTSNIIMALSLLYTPIYLRLTRAEVLARRRAAFVEAARAIGQHARWRSRSRHVLPNSLTPALIQAR